MESEGHRQRSLLLLPRSRQAIKKRAALLRNWKPAVLERLQVAQYQQYRSCSRDLLRPWTRS